LADTNKTSVSSQASQSGAKNAATEKWTELAPRIVVIGVGGAGGNAVDNMIGSELTGVEFIAANTDAQALARSKATHRIQLGANITQGLGAGARPDVGRQAAEDSLDEIRALLKGAHMAFITAGMGGGTGTGAAPVIARVAREAGLLVVAVVTRPFDFEGAKRMRVATEGIEALGAEVDTLIVIPNQNLFRIANDQTTVMEAFKLADEVLHSGVRGVTDLMTRPGLINLDFADVRTVMNEMGKAMMGTGEATGEGRALAAAEAAISNPLLDDVTLRGARAVLINITGGNDMTLFEVNQATNAIRDEVDPEANIIIGSAFDETLDGILRVSVVATGITDDTVGTATPAQRQSFFERHRASETIAGGTSSLGMTGAHSAAPGVSRLEAAAQAPVEVRQEPAETTADAQRWHEPDEPVETYTPQDHAQMPEDNGDQAFALSTTGTDASVEDQGEAFRHEEEPEHVGLEASPHDRIEDAVPPSAATRREDPEHQPARRDPIDHEAAALTTGRRFHPPEEEAAPLNEPSRPAYRAEREAEDRSGDRSFMPFSLFGGRRRRKPLDLERQETRPEPRPEARHEAVRTEPRRDQGLPDDTNDQDDLEIPAFLRRQNIRER
jgi:cell division protein FtsZ